MIENLIYKRIQEFASIPISLKKFQDLLESSSRNNKIRVQWETLDSNTDYYWMWWEPGPTGTTDAGKEMSKTKAAEGMFNVKTTLNSKSGKSVWRTLSLQTVSKCSFENKIYTIT
jgi:hypothetical protein